LTDPKEQESPMVNTMGLSCVGIHFVLCLFAILKGIPQTLDDYALQE
jgi:hypothetical protein